jgi:tetratricopeptide (TPR) repeat protein
VILMLRLRRRRRLARQGAHHHVLAGHTRRSSRRAGTGQPRLSEATGSTRRQSNSTPTSPSRPPRAGQTALSGDELLHAIRRAAELADTVSPAGALIRIAGQHNGRPEIARQHLEALAAAFPDDERVHFMVGSFHFSRTEWQEAIEAYRRALAINEEFAPPYNQLGYALRNLGDFDGAAKAFKRYTELIPDEPNPYDSYAELLMKVGKFQESIAQYEKALEISELHRIGVGMAYDWMSR